MIIDKYQLLDEKLYYLLHRLIQKKDYMNLNNHRNKITKLAKFYKKCI